MAVEGGTRCVKYLLFVFNLLFLLAGLALVIIGAVVTAKLGSFSSISDVNFIGAGIFIIVIGVVIFIISFFGCLGAYKESYCMLIIFIVLMVISLLALIAALIAAFVLRNKVLILLEDGYQSSIPKYSANSNDWLNKLWDDMQENFKCCGSRKPEDWQNNTYLSINGSVPFSCCKDRNAYKANTTACVRGQALKPDPALIYQTGCANATYSLVFNNMVAVGGAAAAIAILQFLGILFASILANALRKEYQVV